MVELAKKFAALLKEGDVVALYGELGAGKTFFTSAVLKELGSDDQVSSPTFALFHEHTTPKLEVVHMDAYRLHDAREIDYIGFSEYLDGKNVMFVEWPEIVLKKLPPNRYEIKIEVDKEDDDKRTIEITYLAEDQEAPENVCASL